MEIADNLGKAAAEVKAGLLRSMRSVMSTVKRAAGYEEENQQAEQIANEMFQVSMWNPDLRNPREKTCEILEASGKKKFNKCVKKDDMPPKMEFF